MMVLRHMIVCTFLIVSSLQSSISQNIPFDCTPLTESVDLSEKMVAGINHFLLDKIQEKKNDREKLWKKSIQGGNSGKFLSENRAFLEDRLGVIQERDRPKMELMVDSFLQPMEMSIDNISIKAVRWNVHEKLYSEGLYLKPQSGVRARLIMIPDADVLPEDLVGISSSNSTWAGIALRMAEQGFEVLIPTLINRDDNYSGSSQFDKWTNQPHREWLYRQSYELGRHIIGEEIQKVLSAVDWFENRSHLEGDKLPIGVMGYGEGGMLAFYSGAIDQRIASTLVSGYFNQREEIWKEPIYRNIFGVLGQMGDAEIATLYSPRNLSIEHSKFPQVNGPPESTPGRSGAAPGEISTPSFFKVKEEWNRIFDHLPEAKNHNQIINSFNYNNGDPFSILAIQRFAGGLNIGFEGRDKVESRVPQPDKWTISQERQKRLVLNMQEVFQHEMNRCERTRDTFFWNKVTGIAEIEQVKAKKILREQLWETLGRLPDPSIPAELKARIVERNTKWTRYEVVLQVWPDVFAWGFLTIPTGIKTGEKRPVVVCQHGLEGLPEDVVSTDKRHKKYGTYKGYATQLAELGYITFAPHNPYRGEDQFRVLQRIANPIGYSLFSVIIGQHQRILEWLGGLDFVDDERIGFYGLSYGGKTALRVPAILEGYALSICSGDFNEWIRNNVSTSLSWSYVFTKEYEIPEWNLGQTFNHAEMAALIAPRGFMVEYGYYDGIGSIEWINYEYGKVRKHYDLIGKSGNLKKEFFVGNHAINGKETFEFLEDNLIR